MRPGWGAAAVVASSLVLGCRASGDRPGYVVLPEMHRSVPYDAYDPNPATGSGQTLVAPPEGTVAVDWRPFLYGPGPDEALRAGAELVSPAVATPEAVARGKTVYENVCVVCHGPKGEGDGSIVGRFPNPPSLLSERAREFRDGRIVHVITHGQGIMAPHAVQVLPADRWRVVLYLRQLQGVAVKGEVP